MKTWTFEGLHFIEVDGKVYILVDDMRKALAEMQEILEESKKN